MAGRTDVTLAQLLRAPYRALVHELYARLAAAGYPELQPAHAAIFPYIRDGVGRSTELAARAGITKQSVGYLVDSLEAAGLVERRPDPQDQRAKVVRLTARGRAAERAATRIIAAIEAEWSRLIGPAEMRALRAALERLNLALAAQPSPGP